MKNRPGRAGPVGWDRGAGQYADNWVISAG